MKFIIKLLLSALAVMILSYILPGVSVTSYTSAIFVALILSILNAILKPILVVLTLPVTIFTLGLFLLIINAFIILLADYFISGFMVSGWLWAILFSILLSVFQSILYSILDKDKN